MNPESCNRLPGTRGADCACAPGTAGCTLSGGASWQGCAWARCGDGEVNNLLSWNGARLNYDLIHEECDDGNVRNGDGCSSICKPEEAGHQLSSAPSLCGNNRIDTGTEEECDDGNRRDFDGCSQECLLEDGICGDDVVQKLLGEQCEQATFDETLPYSCGDDCRFLSLLCNDGKVDPGEQCDDGAENSDTLPDHCRTNCSFSGCGDGLLDASEQCDDGNRLPEDGCDRFCRAETLATTSAPSGDTIDLPFLPPISPSASRPPAGKTGPEVLIFMAAGAASGYAWVRRRRRKK